MPNGFFKVKRIDDLDAKKTFPDLFRELGKGFLVCSMPGMHFFPGIW